MNSTNTPTIVIVPGLRDHIADHWQSRLAEKLPMAVTVPPLDQDKLSCARRVQALDDAISACRGPVILVAHSAGVMMVVRWARHHARPIYGALLAAPADVESPFPDGYPTTESLREHGWLPIPRVPLPFPSILAASENDPLCSLQRATEMALDWGSAMSNIGKAGHLNPASGYGEWPQAMKFIESLGGPLV